MKKKIVKEKISNKIRRILDLDPEFKEILTSPDSIATKRKRIRKALSLRLDAIFDGDSEIPNLKWILVKDAIKVMRSILSSRNEQLAGFSFLGYLNDLLYADDSRDIPIPAPGFLAELEHLLKGIAGKAKIYEEKMPAFARHKGLRAAKLRSSDLSRMSGRAQDFLNLYPSGLNKEIGRRRVANKQRILKYFKATDVEWSDWKWQTRNIIRDADTLSNLINLSPAEYEAVKLAAKYKVPFGITPYYLSLLDYEAGRKRDYAVRAQVIPSLHYVNKLCELRDNPEDLMDFMREKDTSPIEGITRRYPMICILKPVLTCPQICVYCQRNWEIKDVYSKHAVLPKKKLEKAIQWIADTPEINEVLVTGGDPFILSNQKIENLLFRLSSIDHVERIRLGTRTPVTLPQRITESLVRDIIHFHIPGKREITIVTHYEHPYEITSQSMKAVQRFRRYGLEVYNQLVYTFYNSRRFEAAALRHKLRMIGVAPYYTFNTKGKEETDEYRVPIPRLLQEREEEARLMTGTVRTDETVFNVPGLGKNYLSFAQHHDIISILPNGRRVYEFHPWEKKLALADTYIYTDVSVYDYLKRLKAVGEDPSQYKSIWYYY